jgi:regulator of replication initiation timing
MANRNVSNTQKNLDKLKEQIAEVKVEENEITTANITQIDDKLAKAIKNYTVTPDNNTNKLTLVSGSKLIVFYHITDLYIGAHMSRHNVIKHISATFDITIKRASEIFNEFVVYVKQNTIRNIENQYAIAMLRLEELYETAPANIKLGILKEMNKINQLYAANINVNVISTPPIFNIDLGQIDNQIEDQTNEQ